jgi:hypothetical protein
VDQEVAKTLGELELKLQELEHELTTIGHHEKPAAPLQAPGRLIDEAMELGDHDGHRGGGIDPRLNQEENAIADGDGFGGPPVFGGEELPAQAGATVERGWTVDVRETAYGEIPTPPSPDAPEPPHTPPSPYEPPAPDPSPPGPAPPIPPPAPQPPTSPPSPQTSPPPPAMERSALDLAELVRFRNKLAGTMDELIDEYSRLLSVQAPSRRRADA